MPDASSLDRKSKVQRKRRPVVRLQLANGKRHRFAELPEKGEAAPLIYLAIEEQHAETRAVVQSRVLEATLSVDANELVVHLDRVTRLFLRKQAHLLGAALPAAGQPV